MSGHVFVEYNLGDRVEALGETNVRLNDGKYHVVRFNRNGQNSSLQVDDNRPHRKLSSSETFHLPTIRVFMAAIFAVKTQQRKTVFNDQSQIQLGGVWNPTLSRVEKPFQVLEKNQSIINNVSIPFLMKGVMSGVTFNYLRPLDLAAENDQRTKVQGDVHLLDAIPFNYR